MAGNYFDQFATKPANGAPKSANYFDQFATPVPKPSDPNQSGDTARGLKAAFQQLPELGYGLAAIASSAMETAAGEGGMATAAKNWAVKGYKEWGDKIQAGSKETDEFDVSLDRARQGDYGALVDWLQYGVGYTIGQGLQMLGTAGVGALAGKMALRPAVEKLAGGLVAKEAGKIVAAQAAKDGAALTVEQIATLTASEAVRKAAVSNLAAQAGALGATGVQAFGMEGGEIGGDLAQKSAERGTALSGSELLKAFSATMMAGSLEFAGDALGLGAMLGKLPVGKTIGSMTGLPGRASRGLVSGAMAMPIEGGTEYLQTGAEEWGKGSEANILPWDQSPEAQRQALNAGALGALGGIVMGGAGGAMTRPRNPEEFNSDLTNARAVEAINNAPTVDDAVNQAAAEAAAPIATRAPTVTPPTPTVTPPTPTAAPPTPTAAPIGAIVPGDALAGPSPSYERLLNEDAAGGLIGSAMARHDGLQRDEEDRLHREAMQAVDAQVTHDNDTEIPGFDPVAVGQDSSIDDFEAALTGKGSPAANDAVTPVTPVTPGQTPEVTPRPAPEVWESWRDSKGRDRTYYSSGNKFIVGYPDGVFDPLLMTNGKYVSVSGVPAKSLEEAKALYNPQGQPATPIDEAAHTAATSPLNDTPQPTEAQKKAGNYAKGHINVGGMDISIENPAGSKRRPEWPTLAHHYGYLKGTIGYDKDHVDVFVKTETPENWKGTVYVVNQNKDKGGFDEHKAMIGFDSQAEARAAYLENYTAGWEKNIHSLVPMPTTLFKKWAEDTAKTGPTGGPIKALGAKPLDTIPAAPVGVFDLGKLDIGRLNQVEDVAGPEGKAGIREAMRAITAGNADLALAELRNAVRYLERQQRPLAEVIDEIIDAAMVQADAKVETVDKPQSDADPKILRDAGDFKDAEAVGASPGETKEIGEVFDEAKQSELGDDGEQITHVFDSPTKSDVVRLADKVKVYNAKHGWMTVEQAKAKIEDWEDHAIKQVKSGLNSDKVVLSLFDLTGGWSRPWEQAGYDVYRFDIQGDIKPGEPEYVPPESPDYFPGINGTGDVTNFSTEFFNDLFGSFDGKDIHAILAAVPCTDFAVSGARHFAVKDADGRTRDSVELVGITLATIEFFKPAIWAIENPVGRIEKLGNLPPWRLSFDPNHMGDPYTKKTILWGRFNADLPIVPVEPTEGSKMWAKYGGKSLATKNARSATPEGFAYSFFMANNAIDNPVLAIHGKYDRLDRGLIEKAVGVGVTAKQIDEAVEDFYYQELDDDAANQAIRDLMTPPTKPIAEKPLAEKRAQDLTEAEAEEKKVAEPKDSEVAPVAAADAATVSADDFEVRIQRAQAKIDAAANKSAVDALLSGRAGKLPDQGRVKGASKIAREGAGHAITGVSKAMGRLEALFGVNDAPGSAPISVKSSEALAQDTALPVAAELDKALDATDKADAAEALGHDAWTPEAAQTFLEHYADWLAAGARDLGTRLGEIFHKVLASVRAGLLSIMVAISPMSQQITEVTVPVTKTAYTLTIKHPTADFKGVAAGVDAKIVADWVVRKSEAKGKPFVVVDKNAGLLYVMDTKGALVAKAPVLTGAALGDRLTPEQADLPIDKVTQADKITPAGRFDGSVVTSPEYGPVVKFAEYAKTQLSIHRVYLGAAFENRLGRLLSETGADNRVSYGCLNALPEFVSQVLVPTFRDGGVVYILPAQQSAASFFAIPDDAITTQTVTGQEANLTWGADKYSGALGMQGGTPALRRRGNKAREDFDEDTWAKANPLLKEAYAEFVAAGKPLDEFIEHVLTVLSSAVKPYLKRWHEELNKPESSTQTAATVEPTPVAPKDEATVEPKVKPKVKPPTKPPEPKIEKMQDTGEKMFGKRADNFTKTIREADTGNKKKDLKKILDNTSKSTLWEIKLADGSTPGTKVFLERVRDSIKSFLQYAGEKAGGGRASYRYSFAVALERYIDRTPENKAEVEKMAGQYMATMEELRNITQNAMTVEQARAALEAALVDKVFAEDQVVKEGLKRSDADFHESGFTQVNGKQEATRLYGWNTDFGKNLAQYLTRAASLTTLHSAKFGLATEVKDETERSRSKPLIRPQLEAVNREGMKDHRNGRNIGAQDFIDTFGFRGVEFGNWVEAAKRPQDVNQSFDALHDLADTMGIDPKGISLGGKLGLAFGSRGHGRAAAHYESGNVVINLTKTKGDGTVAHEWGHAFDYALRRAGGADTTLTVVPHPDGNGYALQRYGGELVSAVHNGEDVPKQWKTERDAKKYGIPAHTVESNSKTKAALRDLVNALKKTYDTEKAIATVDNLLMGNSYVKGRRASNRLEQARDFITGRYWNNPGWGVINETQFKKDADKLGKEYWGNDEELWARSWEAFIYDAMAGESPYLVTSWVADKHVTTENGYKGSPYPIGDERARFSTYFRHLLGNIEWTETGPMIKEGYVSVAVAHIKDMEAALDALLPTLEERLAQLQTGEAKSDGLFWYRSFVKRGVGAQPKGYFAFDDTLYALGYPEGLDPEELRVFGLKAMSPSWQPGENAVYLKKETTDGTSSGNNTIRGDGTETLGDIPPDDGGPSERTPRLPGSDTERPGTVQGDDRLSGEQTGQRSGERTGSGTGEVHPPAERSGTTDLGSGQDAIRPTGTNYRITAADHLGEGSIEVKFNDNIAAIKTLKLVESENRLATPEEQKILVRYVGWGGMPQAFNYAEQAGWKERTKELASLLTETEYDAARASTTNAHYTAEAVVKAIWSGVAHLGFTGGRVLEPGVGTGNFLGLMPEELMLASKLTGIELDTLTARIAKQLYQQANILNKGYQDAMFPKGFFDLVISNVPFSNTDHPVDKIYNKERLNLHDYYFHKSIELTRPGGLIAFITSKGTLDKMDTKARKLFAERADFIGAVRLPQDAFAQNAGTVVTTDIIFFRRKVGGLEYPNAQPWINTEAFDLPGIDGGTTPMAINEYFGTAIGADGLLGRLVARRGRYGYETESALESDGRDLGEAINTALMNLPANVMVETARVTELEHDALLIPLEGEAKDGGYAQKEGKLYRREGDMMAPVAELSKVEISRGQIIRSSLKVRDSIRRLLRNRVQNEPESVIKEAKLAIEAAYKAFVKKHGFLNAQANVEAFSEDPDAALLLALEKWNPETAKGARIEIDFHLRAPIEHTDNVKDALTVSLGERGRVDWGTITRLTGMSEALAKAELKGIVYDDPQQGWVTAEEYLSGNVREKLLIAKAAAEADTDFAPNVAALEASLPTDLPPSKISARPGAPWIPGEDVAHFMGDMLNTQRRITVHFIPEIGKWTIAAGMGRSDARDKQSYKSLGSGTEARVTWGTPQVPFPDLMDYALNGGFPVVYDPPDRDGKKEVNRKETASANSKLSEIKERFAKWIWEDDARAVRLARKYNDEMNGVRLRTYAYPASADQIEPNGNIRLPGMAVGMSLRPHQAAAVWRTVQAGNTYYAHEVGTGKTFTMVATVMEEKRLGLAKKPMMVVLLSTLPQIQAEFLRLYPGANILTMEIKQNAIERKRQLARIALSDWDAVIVTHDSFSRIPMSEESIRANFQREIDNLSNAILAAKGENMTARVVKELEKAKKALDNRMKRELDKRAKDDLMPFEQLGVDRIYIDEAQKFKNLMFATRMGRQMRGLQPEGSGRAFDLFMKTNWLNDTQGRGVVLSSGTPISNSVGELFSISRFLQPSELRKRGLQMFDPWANTFGDIGQVIEYLPEGGGYQMVTKFNKFVNIPELMQMVYSVLDPVSADSAGIQRPAIAGGKQEAVLVPQNEGVADYMTKIQERAATIRKNGKQALPDNMLAVVGDGRKAAMDMRLVNPSSPDYEHTKTNAAVDKIMTIYKREAKDRGTQLVFADLGVPHPGKFSIYTDLKAKLIKRGIPADEIAFIHDAKDARERQALFARVNAGKVRVFIGSTEKAGTGVNVQERVAAIHNLDTHWNLANLLQRLGRGQRQGNIYKELAVYNYATERTVDAFMWDKVQAKGRFVDQIMSGDVSLREAEDISQDTMSAAEMVAVASGDPMIAEKVELEATVQKLSLQSAAFEDTRHSVRIEAARTPERIAGLTKTMETIRVEADGFDTVNRIILGKTTYVIEDDKTREAMNKALHDLTMDNRARVDKIEKEYESLKSAGKKKQAEALRTGSSAREIIGSLSGEKVSYPLYARSGLGGDYVVVRTAAGDEEWGADLTAGRGLSYVRKNLEFSYRKASDEVDVLREELPKLTAEAAKTFGRQDELDTKRARLQAIETVLLKREEPEAPNLDELKDKYRFTASRDGTANVVSQFEDITFEEFPEIAFFISESPDGRWVITHTASGLQAVSADSKEQAIANAKSTFDGRLDVIKEKLDNAPVITDEQKVAALVKSGVEDGPSVYSVTEAAVPAEDQLSVAAITQIVEDRLQEFVHQPPVLIRDSVTDIPAHSADNAGVAGGMVRDGKIHLFRDGLTDSADVVRVLWHELLHYGLRRFLTKEQYIAKLGALYQNDKWIRDTADAWLATDEGEAVQGDKGYRIARGVDEALAKLAETSQGEYRNNGLLAKAIRTVSRWVANLADRLGFSEAAAKWRGATNDEARALIRATFTRLREDAAPTSDAWGFTADAAFSRRGGQTETPEFKKWFGGSRVVDAVGNPLVVYHGTTANIRSAFSAKKSSIKNAIFFTDSTEAANNYAAGHGAEYHTGANVVPVFLRMGNPLVLDFDGAGDNDLLYEVEAAQEEGYDGLIVNNAFDGKTHATQYIVFSPTQIKSAIGNNGNYNGAKGSMVEQINSPDFVSREEAEQMAVGEPRHPVRVTDRLIKLAKSDLSPEELKDQLGRLIFDLDARKYAKPTKPRSRGYEWVKERLTREARWGGIDSAQARLAMWLLDQNPDIANDLGLSIRQAKDGESGTAANYNPASRIASIIKGRGDEETIAHEILHHTERMMPEDIQIGIRQEWARQLGATLDGAIRTGNDDLAKMVHEAIKAAAGDNQAHKLITKAINNGELPHDFYQFINPSEFWAVNASRLIKERAGAGWVGRAAQWLRGLMEQIKSAFGLPSDAAVLRGLRAVLRSDGEAINGMLGAGDKFNAPPIAGSNTTGGFEDSITSQTTAFIRDMLHSDAKMGWWSRSIGTQAHKALTHRLFRRVYDEGQAFLSDVSKFANEAADAASDLLPRIEGLKDFWKKTPTKDEIARVTKAVYVGTLYGGGKPMEGRKFTNDELRAGRSEDSVVEEFTPLNDREISLYHQAMNAMAISLDSMAKSLIHKLARVHEIGFDRNASLQDAATSVMEAADEAIAELEDELEGLIDDKAAKSLNAAIVELRTLKTQVSDIELKTQTMKDKGYFPAMRFGQYFIHVIEDVNGRKVQRHFGLYESQTQANLAARELAKEYHGATLDRGMISKEKYKLFQGVNLDTIEAFADYITGENGQPLSKDPIVQGFLKAAASERGILKHRIHRKGAAGYSVDLPRVLASFVVSNARATSSNYHASEMTKLAQAIPDGDEQDEAVKLVRYLQDPVEEAQALRGFMFAQFLGGSIAHGIVNMTQPFMVTVPYLTQHTSATDAARKIGEAMKTKPESLTGRIKADFERAKKDGVVAPQEIHQLRAETGGMPLGRSLLARKASFLWGSIYSITEQFNRSTTFIAAYRVAEEKGMSDPYAFASNAVNETQFVYNKGNRPNWARGPVGATVFTFKQFSISYLELAKRMYDHKGPDGRPNRKAFYLMVLMLLAASGAEGAPFSEDIEDLIDTIGQWMGYATNSKKSLRKLVTAALGPDLAPIALHGVSGLSWMPVDISVRMGMQNLIPGTSLLKPSEKNKARDVLDIIGPVGQLVPAEGTMMGRTIERLSKGDLFGAVQAGAPVAVQNVLKGAVMLDKGYATDSSGKKITDVTATESVLKMVGLQPASVARESSKMQVLRQDVDIHRRTESEIADKWARGIVDKDPEEVQAARRQLADWNRDNPELRIQIQMSQIARRAKEMRTPRDARFIKAAPREIRGVVREGMR